MKIPPKNFFLEPPLKDKDFQVRGIGFHERMQPGFVNRPCGTGDYLMMYFHSEVHAGGSEKAELLPPGHMVVWTPGGYQYYGHPTRAYVHSWIHCDGSMIEPLLESNGIPLRSPFPLPCADVFLRFLSDLYQELTPTGAQPDNIIAQNLFENWMRHLGRSLASLSDRVPERLRAVKKHLDAHYAEPLSLAQLAGMAHWSVPHFASEFHKAFGSSPIDYAIRRRLHHAAYLLQDINLSVTEIAQRVGYSDLYHFSKLFKNHYGMSPRALREDRRVGNNRN